MKSNPDNEPKYSDVIELPNEIEYWKQTYEYRGIKYDMSLVQRISARWYIIIPNEESHKVVELVNNTDLINRNFLYIEEEVDEEVSENPMHDIFYDAICLAEKDIDWFWDDALDDMKIGLEHDIDLFSELFDIVGDKSEKIEHASVGSVGIQMERSQCDGINYLHVSNYNEPELHEVQVIMPHIPILIKELINKME